MSRKDQAKETRELVQKSFMIGVNWLLKILEDGDKDSPGLWGTFNADTAEILREKAKKVIADPWI